MKTTSSLPLAVSLLFAAGVLSSQASTLIVPVFGNTSAQYNATVSAAKSQALVAVINPDNGAGSGRIGKTAKFVNKVQGTGSLAIGYIITSYGSRGVDSIKSEINRYVSSYGVDGIFLDQMSDSLSNISVYREIYKYAKSKGLKVFGNPGTHVPKGYASVTDVLITYEDTYGAGFKSQKRKSWTKKYGSKKFGAIVSSTSDLSGALAKAEKNGQEFVYVTDRTEPNPYGSVPSYFNEQVSAVKGKGINVQAIPEPGAAVLGLLGVAGAFLRRRRR